MREIQQQRHRRYCLLNYEAAAHLPLKMGSKPTHFFAVKIIVSMSNDSIYTLFCLHSDFELCPSIIHFSFVLSLYVAMMKPRLHHVTVVLV
jgi:hypothetical protein